MHPPSVRHHPPGRIAFIAKRAGAIIVKMAANPPGGFPATGRNRVFRPLCGPCNYFL